MDTVTYLEQILDLDFYFSEQQLFIDDCLISGEVSDFHCSIADEGGLLVLCRVLVGRN